MKECQDRVFKKSSLQPGSEPSISSKYGLLTQFNQSGIIQSYFQLVVWKIMSISFRRVWMRLYNNIKKGRAFFFAWQIGGAAALRSPRMMSISSDPASIAQTHGSGMLFHGFSFAMSSLCPAQSRSSGADWWYSLNPILLLGSIFLLALYTYYGGHYRWCYS